MRGGGAQAHALRLEGAKVGVVIAPYYREIAEALLAGAEAAIAASGAAHSVFSVPGALEIPLAIATLEDGGRRALPRFDGYVALGCVIRGETAHFDIVCNESARGLMQLGLGGRFAVANGVLTVDTLDQAWERADPARLDKGGEAAKACLSLVALRRSAP